MAQPKSGDSGPPLGARQTRRRSGRRRTVLNLGMPFLQIDDFVNQSEDAVRLGYRVLVQTVEEIKKGYKQAEEFHKLQRAYEKGQIDTPPTIPWQQMVDRLESIQDIGLGAVKKGTKIVTDAMRSSMESTRRLASTWQESRQDVDAPPVLAGPVFEDPVDVSGRPGESPKPVTWRISHRGLARLRINAAVDPAPKRMRRVDEPEDESSKTSSQGAEAKRKEEQDTYRGSIDVSFDRSTDPVERLEGVSVLSVDFHPIPTDQDPGVYVGIIRASNFELLIARLRINVLKPAEPARSSRVRVGRARPRGRKK